jgi:hypothetical protein
MLDSGTQRRPGFVRWLSVIVVLCGSGLVAVGQAPGGAAPPQVAQRRDEGHAKPTIEVNCPATKAGPDWAAGLLPLAGVVIGGLISLAGAWFKDQRDSQDAVQRWFEEAYTFGAIGSVLGLLETWSITLEHQKTALSPAPPPAEFPVADIARLRLVLRTQALDTILLTAAGLMKRTAQEGEVRDALIASIGRTRQAVVALQEALLQVQIKARSQVPSLVSRENIQEVARTLEIEALSILERRN